MAVLSGREVCATLAEHGFVEMRPSGGHVVMQKKERGATKTIPIPNHGEIRSGTLQAIIRQSGLPASAFRTK